MSQAQQTPAQVAHRRMLTRRDWTATEQAAARSRDKLRAEKAAEARRLLRIRDEQARLKAESAARRALRTTA